MPKTITIPTEKTVLLPPRDGRLGYRITVVSGGAVAFSYQRESPDPTQHLTFANGDQVSVGQKVFVIEPEIARHGVLAISSTGAATVSYEELA